MTDQDGYRIEAAVQFGFTEEAEYYVCTEAQLIAFAKACERKGLADAREMARLLREDMILFSSKSVLYDLEAEIERVTIAFDAELTPVREAEEARFMTAQGYVRGSDEPGKRWVKP